MAYSPPIGYYLPDEQELYYHICKWHIINPSAVHEDVLHFIEFFTPSWYLSNGYLETVSEDWLLEKLVYNRRQPANDLHQRMRCIHFIQLFVPKTIQERLMTDTYE